jgi:hypothetical protein
LSCKLYGWVLLNITRNVFSPFLPCKSTFFCESREAICVSRCFKMHVFSRLTYHNYPTFTVFVTKPSKRKYEIDLCID